MSVQTSAGSKLYISTTLPGSIDAAGFGAVTGWVEVGEVTDLGEFGAEYNLVTYTSLGTRQTRKIKGSYNNGSLQLQMGRDTTDAGQTALRNALGSDNSFSFKVVLQNATATMYFTGKVMSYKTSVGSVDQITAASTTVEVDSNVIEV